MVPAPYLAGVAVLGAAQEPDVGVRGTGHDVRVRAGDVGGQRPGRVRGGPACWPATCSPSRVVFMYCMAASRVIRRSRGRAAVCARLPRAVRVPRSAPPACPGRDRTVVVVAPRVRASAPVNRAEAQMALAGRADTITPALWAYVVGEARVRVPGPAVADAAVQVMVSWLAPS